MEGISTGHSFTKVMKDSKTDSDTGTSSTYVWLQGRVLVTLLTGSEWKGDVGGQKTLRTYWRNYFEKTDALVWVVDAADRYRIKDCREELAGLLLEEVCHPRLRRWLLTIEQRLMGASLLVFSNKTDIEDSMSDEEIRTVRVPWYWTSGSTAKRGADTSSGVGFGRYQDT